MIASLVISPFPSKETLISSLKMILFGQQTLRCKLFQISSYITEQMAVLWLWHVRLPSQAMLRTSPGAFQWSSRQILGGGRYVWPGDPIKNCALDQLPTFTTQEQIPQDPERGTHGYGDTSGKFDWIIKINNSLLWEKTKPLRECYTRRMTSFMVIVEMSLAGGYRTEHSLIVPWAWSTKGHNG